MPIIDERKTPPKRKYKVTGNVNISGYWNFEYEDIEAESEYEAKSIARDRAYDEYEARYMEVTDTDTEIQNIEEIISAETNPF